jgi:hypothetical protein
MAVGYFNLYYFLHMKCDKPIQLACSHVQTTGLLTCCKHTKWIKHVNQIDQSQAFIIDGWVTVFPRVVYSPICEHPKFQISNMSPKKIWGLFLVDSPITYGWLLLVTTEEDSDAGEKRTALLPQSYNQSPATGKEYAISNVGLLQQLILTCKMLVQNFRSTETQGQGWRHRMLKRQENVAINRR